MNPKRRNARKVKSVKFVERKATGRRIVNSFLKRGAKNFRNLTR